MHYSYSYLLQFVCDHGESSEDAVCGAGDGDDPLWTGALWDVDPSTALWRERGHEVSTWLTFPEQLDITGQNRIKRSIPLSSLSVKYEATVNS